MSIKKQLGVLLLINIGMYPVVSYISHSVFNLAPGGLHDSRLSITAVIFFFVLVDGFIVDKFMVDKYENQ